MSGLPEAWACASLADVADLEMGQSPPGEKTNTERRGLPLIGGAADFKHGRIVPSRYTDAPTKVSAPGDIILCIRATIGKTAQGDAAYCLGRGVAGLRPAAIHGDLLRYLLSKDSRALDEAGTGTTFRQVDKSTLSKWPVPLPPLAEQRRIVAKLDTLTARTARARADLDRIPALAARYKQAVLAKIFGELDQQPERLVDLVDPTRGIPYGIVQTGVAMPSGVPTVRCGDVRQFSVAKDGLKLVAQDIADAYPRTLLRGGEVLLAIRGSVGNSAVVGPEFAGCNISREVAMIPVGDRLRPRFAMFFLGSPEAQAYLKRHIKGVAQTGINLEDVRSLTLPVPELHVQDAVIEKIERALAEIDRLTAEAGAARRLLDRLDQAILARAFRGELVPQDPADEPASVLLKRIRAERAAAPKPIRGRRKAAA